MTRGTYWGIEQRQQTQAPMVVGPGSTPQKYRNNCGIGGEDCSLCMVSSVAPNPVIRGLHVVKSDLLIYLSRSRSRSNSCSSLVVSDYALIYHTEIARLTIQSLTRAFGRFEPSEWHYSPHCRRHARRGDASGRYRCSRSCARWRRYRRLLALGEALEAGAKVVQTYVANSTRFVAVDLPRMANQ